LGYYAPIKLARIVLLFLIFGVLLIFPLVSNGEAFLQTGGQIEIHINPGESQSFTWGLNSESDKVEVIKLRAEEAGRELLTFPETIVLQPGEWFTVIVTVSIPEDHPNDVLLQPRIYALLDNTGNGVQPILAQIGLGWVGQETPTPVLHLNAPTTTLQVPLSGAGGPVGPVPMDDTAGGTDAPIANLVGGPETVSISVDGSSPINPPASGVLTTTLTVTADSGDCFTFIA